MGLARNKTRAHLIAMSHNLKTGIEYFQRTATFKGELCLKLREHGRKNEVNL